MNMFFHALIKLSVLIIFNIFFWVLCGTDNPASVWVSYAFIHVVYLFFVFAGFLVRNANGQMVLCGGRYIIASSWAISEMILGTLFIVLAKNEVLEGVQWPLVVQSVLAVIFLCAFGFEFLAGGATASSLARDAADASFLNNVRITLQSALSQVEDPDLKRELQQCMDQVASSPIQSSASVRTEEQHIAASAKALLELVASGAPSEKILPICRSLKSELLMRREKLKLA